MSKNLVQISIKSHFSFMKLIFFFFLEYSLGEVFILGIIFSTRFPLSNNCVVRRSKFQIRSPQPTSPSQNFLKYLLLLLAHQNH